MLKLTDLAIGQSLVGLEPDAVVSLMAVTHLAEGAAQVVYVRPDGQPKIRLLNEGDLAQFRFELAMVLIGENDAIDGPYYLRNPFNREPQWGVATMDMKLADILERSEKQ